MLGICARISCPFNYYVRKSEGTRSGKRQLFSIALMCHCQLNLAKAETATAPTDRFNSRQLWVPHIKLFYFFHRLLRGRSALTWGFPGCCPAPPLLPAHVPAAAPPTRLPGSVPADAPPPLLPAPTPAALPPHSPAER